MDQKIIFTSVAALRTHSLYPLAGEPRAATSALITLTPNRAADHDPAFLNMGRLTRRTAILAS